MSRFLRQSIFVLVLVSIALIVQTLYFALYRDWRDFARSQARKANILLDVARFESRFPATLAFERIGAVVPIGRLPLPVAVEKGEVSVDLLPLFRLHGAFRYFAEMYGGTIRGAGRKSILGENLEILASGSGLQLSKYPQMGAKYVEGELNFELDAQAAKSPHGFYFPNQGALRVTLRKGVYHGGLKIQGLIPIAAMDDVTADLSVQLDESSIYVSQFRFHSSLGDVNGTGRFQIADDFRPTSGKATFAISLTPLGASAYGGYLQLAANGHGTPTTTQWEGELEMKQVGRPPAIRLIPLR